MRTVRAVYLSTTNFWFCFSTIKKLEKDPISVRVHVFYRCVLYKYKENREQRAESIFSGKFRVFLLSSFFYFLRCCCCLTSRSRAATVIYTAHGLHDAACPLYYYAFDLWSPSARVSIKPFPFGLYLTCVCIYIYVDLREGLEKKTNHGPNRFPRCFIAV